MADTKSSQGQHLNHNLFLLAIQNEHHLFRRSDLTAKWVSTRRFNRILESCFFVCTSGNHHVALRNCGQICESEKYIFSVTDLFIPLLIANVVKRDVCLCASSHHSMKTRARFGAGTSGRSSQSALRSQWSPRSSDRRMAAAHWWSHGLLLNYEWLGTGRQGIMFTWVWHSLSCSQWFIDKKKIIKYVARSSNTSTRCDEIKLRSSLPSAPQK